MIVELKCDIYIEKRMKYITFFKVRFARVSCACYIGVLIKPQGLKWWNCFVLFFLANVDQNINSNDNIIGYTNVGMSGRLSVFLKPIVWFVLHLSNKFQRRAAL